MVTVYVLKSLIVRYRYVGITSDFSDRLKRHDSGRSKATRPYRPFTLIYKEEYSDYVLAREREKFLKSGAGRKWLDALEC